MLRYVREKGPIYWVLVLLSILFRGVKATMEDM
jgi:hypothetical protein